MSHLLRVVQFILALSRDIRYARPALVLVIAAGLVSGVINTGLIVLINRALTNQGLSLATVGWGFLVLCVGLPLFRFVSQTALAWITQKSLFHLRVRWCRRILSTPLRQLEELGPQRLLASLTNDLGAITEALSALPLVLMHLAVVVTCLAYLGWLSPMLLLALLGFMVVGIVTYQIPILSAIRYQRQARERWDVLFHHIRAITQGTKELKMSQPRREALMSRELEPTADALQRDITISSAIFAAGSSWGQIVAFLAIGLLLFVLPRYYPVSGEVLLGFSTTMIFLLAPLEMILVTLPRLSNASVSIRKLDEIGLSLQRQETEADAATLPAADWRRLDLVGVTHSYRGENEGETFQLGPVDLSLEAGEMVFLVGGNGSGKTTLAKVILGLYMPESGEIRIDGEPVTRDGIDRYRQRFAVVFSDFFLFENLVGLEGAGLDEDARRYLTELRLDRKVRIENGKLSTTDLSQGQRKRLALLAAYLEDRPLYLFDEWAADQDPLFKEIFYLHLLPQLKARGKTVLVISHDDHYYGVADRIIKLDAGQVESDSRAHSSRMPAPDPGAPSGIRRVTT
jgi:putative ATP-binding cassette transporter